MMRSRLTMALRCAQAPLLAAALAGSAGCMSFDDAEPITLGTHVEDWRNEIIYQVLVDRFADGDTGNNYRVDLTSMGHWHGGDWKGLEDRLDYIAELGVTAIWISPVVKNVDTDAGFDGYHGYWAQDLDLPNAHFGDIPALRHMVATAHDKGLKVILDIVTNHMGQLFYYDINMNGQPDDQVSGGGCDKWGDPSNTGDLWPNYSNSDANCKVKDGQSGVKHVTEYDPEFNPEGVIQAYTSLGYSGPAPIVFNSDPGSNHMAPLPLIFQTDPTAFNRRGRTINYSKGDQLLHGDFPGGLKDVNTLNCNVKQAMVDSYARWVEIADFDGFRIDTLKHVEPEFWRYFAQMVRRRLKAQGKSNFFMFGEAFDGADDLVGSFTKNGDVPQNPVWPQSEVLGTPDLAKENASCDHGSEPLNADMVDSAFYFPQYYQAIGNVFRDEQGTKGIQNLWSSRATNWGAVPAKDGTGIPPYKLPVNFLDNHDVGRFLFYQFFHKDIASLKSGAIKDVPTFNQIRDDKLRNALVFLFTEQGIPCVYYGDEHGFEGGNDPANREDLWPTKFVTDTTADENTGRVNGRFFQWIRKLADIRKKHKAFTHGEQTVVWATDHTGGETDAGIFAFERTGGDAGDGYALVVLNTNGAHTSSPEDGGTKMKSSAFPGTVLVDLLSDNLLSYPVEADGGVTLQVPALRAAVLVPQNQVAGN